MAEARPRFTMRGRPLLAGEAAAPALVLDEPLSFWGGLDPATGRIIDVRHAQRGEPVVGRVLVMSGGRGSSSSSSVLAETIRLGLGPAAIVLATPDEIVLLGALVAQLLYGESCPVLELAPSQHAQLRTGDLLSISEEGVLEVGRPAALT